MTPSEYLSQIGKKGGHAGKGTQARIEANKRAAKASWTPEARAKRKSIPLDERSLWIKEKAQQKADDEIPGIQPDEYSQQHPDYENE